MSDLVDFGAPTHYGAHRFAVDIPSTRSDAVSIVEEFGFDGDVNQREKAQLRALVARPLWTKIRDDARRDFNRRLTEKRLPTASWHNAGTTYLDRFLGRELCVLAWAAEHASPSECPIICQQWLVLRPEERWWLYSKTVAHAGGAYDGEKGWRKALYCALSDATGIVVRTKVAATRSRKKKESSNAPETLFDFMEKGEI